MLHTLLLQATTHTSTVEVTSLTNVYIALGGTLTAAILAALASWNAAKTAERAASLSAATTQKVADLSRQTTREVADLSAQVSRESAGLAAQTAREIKETDYKHDFYKKIIERRLKAWEEAERFLAYIDYHVKDDKDDKNLYFHCNSGEKFDKVLEQMQSLTISQQLWLNKQYGEAFVSFFNTHATIRREASILDDRDDLAPIDDNLLREAGKRHFSKMKSQIAILAATLSAQLYSMHNVESFLTRFRDIEQILQAKLTPEE